MKKINIIILTLIIAGCSQSENASKTVIKDQLSKIIPIELNIESITDSQLPNFFEVKLSDGSFFYVEKGGEYLVCLLYTSPSPRDATLSRMPSSA